MTVTRYVPPAGFGALVLGAVFTLAAPLLPHAQVAQAGQQKEETTITIETSKDKEATVLKLEPMKIGETKSMKTESGKPVTVTRTADGYTVKVGEREIRVKVAGDDEANVLLPGGKEVRVLKGHDCGGEDVNMVFTGDDAKKVVVRKHAYAYRAGGGGPKADAAEVLKKAAPKSLETLDRRTRDAVEQVLQEMLDKGAVLPTADLPMVWSEKDGGDGERVKVMVLKEKKEDGAKK